MTELVTPKGKTYKTAFYILLIYMACQLSSFLLILFPDLADALLEMTNGATPEEQLNILSAWWSTITFGIAFIASFLLIARDKSFWNNYKGKKATITEAIVWGIIGFFMVFVGQSIGASIETALGIEVGSENTAQLSDMMKAAPIMILATVIFGPVLEELIFRRVLFGSLIQKYNFWISAFVSALVFAAIHLEFKHIILYAISGFIFAFLYHKTKSIWTSIIAHMMLNGFVTIVQLNMERIQKWLEILDKYLKNMPQ